MKLEKKKKLSKLFNTLQPYVNGKLITFVFVKYWEEIKKELNIE